MESITGQFVSTYLIMPIIAVIAGFVMILIAKKNELLKNKKAIVYLLSLWIALTLPALMGFFGYWFMPYAYLGAMLFSFALGLTHIYLMHILMPKIVDKPFYVEFLFAFISMLIGMGLFALVFNLCNELQYGFWAATALMPFLFPCIFCQTYIIFLNTPLEVYKEWNYHKQIGAIDPDLIDYSKVLVVEIEIYKKPGDEKVQNIKAKSSEDLYFGTWFKVFLDDYNKRTPLSPIVYSDSESTGWVFYIISSILGRKKYIDPDLTLAQNNIKEKNVIIAKRSKFNENK